MSESGFRLSSGSERVYGHLHGQIRDPWSEHEVFWFGGALVVVRLPDGRLVVDVVNVTIDGHERRAKYARAKAAGRGRRSRSRRSR